MEVHLIKFWIKFSAWALAIFLAIILSLIYLSYIGFDGGFSSHMKKGDTEYAAGNYKAALSDYNRASSITSSDASAKLGVVKSLIALDRQSDAIGVLEKFMESDPKSQEIYESLIALYETNTGYEQKLIDLLKNAASKFGNEEYADKAAVIARQMSTVDPPTVDIVGGKYDDPVTVKITNLKNGETAYYTTDNASPTDASQTYSESDGIAIPEGKTVLKLIKYNATGSSSSVVALSYAVGEIEEDPAKTLITAEFGNNAMNGGIVAAYNGFIFYSNQADGKKLYRMYPTGGESTLISSDKVSYLNPYGGNIYYINESDGNKIYSVTIDGANRTAIGSDAAGYMLVAGEYIFYSNKTDGNKLYRMKLDGSEKAVVTSDRVTEFNILSGTIYYRNDTDKEYLYSISYDGFDRTLLISQRVHSLNVYGTSLYFINFSDGGKIYTSALDGSGSTLLSPTPANEILSDSTGIYFIVKSNRDLYKINFNGVQQPPVVEGANASKLSGAFNLLFYVNYSNAKDMHYINKN